MTAELDQSLLARFDELQKQIDALYAQAEAALDRHAGVPEPPLHAGPSPAPPERLRADATLGKPTGHRAVMAAR